LTVPIRSAAGIEAGRSPRSTEEGYTARMCNLYSMTKAQDAMHHLFRVKRDRAGICRRFRGSSPIRWRPWCASIKAAWA